MCLVLLILIPHISNQSQVHAQYQVGVTSNLNHLLFGINIDYLRLIICIILALLRQLVKLHIHVIIRLRQLLTELDLICRNCKTIHFLKINLFDHSFGVQL